MCQKLHLTLGCQRSYCSCNLFPTISKAFCGLIDEGSVNTEISLHDNYIPLKHPLSTRLVILYFNVINFSVNWWTWCYIRYNSRHKMLFFMIETRYIMFIIFCNWLTNFACHNKNLSYSVTSRRKKCLNPLGTMPNTIRTLQ